MEHLIAGLSERSPSVALLQFVERLPTTIRGVVLGQCCLAFGRLQPGGRQDLLATFRAILMKPDAPGHAYECAKMIAVVELVLQSDRIEAASPLELSDGVPAYRSDAADIRSPLAEKHWQAAQEEFRHLRKSVLNIDSLRQLHIDTASADAVHRSR